METNSRQQEEPGRPSYLRFGWHAWALASIVLWVALFTSHERPSAVTEQWPVAVAMLLGSYFAGSTPLGGGVVGFPILVLGFGFDASVGRDFSFAIQSVGDFEECKEKHSYGWNGFSLPTGMGSRRERISRGQSLSSPLSSALSSDFFFFFPFLPFPFDLLLPLL